MKQQNVWCEALATPVAYEAVTRQPSVSIEPFGGVRCLVSHGLCSSVCAAVGMAVPRWVASDFGNLGSHIEQVTVNKLMKLAPCQSSVGLHDSLHDSLTNGRTAEEPLHRSDKVACNALTCGKSHQGS